MQYLQPPINVKCKGFSLAEMTVALVIVSFAMLGVSQLSIDTYSVQRDEMRRITVDSQMNMFVDDIRRAAKTATELRANGGTMPIPATSGVRVVQTNVIDLRVAMPAAQDRFERYGIALDGRPFRQISTDGGNTWGAQFFYLGRVANLDEGMRVLCNGGQPCFNARSIASGDGTGVFSVNFNVGLNNWVVQTSLANTNASNVAAGENTQNNNWMGSMRYAIPATMISLPGAQQFM